MKSLCTESHLGICFLEHQGQYTIPSASSFLVLPHIACRCPLAQGRMVGMILERIAGTWKFIKQMCVVMGC